jgi:hypothetical protein
MKRRTFFLAVALVVMFSGCNREQIADLVLAVSFHPALDRPTADSSVSEKPGVAASAQHSFEQLMAAMLELQEVRPTIGHEQVDSERLREIVDQIHTSCEELTKAEEITATEHRQVREA